MKFIKQLLLKLVQFFKNKFAKLKPKNISKKFSNIKKKKFLTTKIKDKLIETITDLEDASVLNTIQKQQLEWYKNIVKNALDKVEQGKRISTREKDAVQTFDKNFFNDEVQTQYIQTPKSKWIKWVSYTKKTKSVAIKMKYKVYIFYNVPKTKWLRFLTEPSAGEYMWNYFGKHYSLHPSRWIRKGNK